MRTTGWLAKFSSTIACWSLLTSMRVSSDALPSPLPSSSSCHLPSAVFALHLMRIADVEADAAGRPDLADARRILKGAKKAGVGGVI